MKRFLLIPGGPPRPWGRLDWFGLGALVVYLAVVAYVLR